MSKPTHTQLAILRNAVAGRRLDAGRAPTQSAAAGWGCSTFSCVRKGWLDRDHQLTDLGRAEVKIADSPAGAVSAKTNEELLRQTRENAVEMAVRSILQRQFGNYQIDGARGLISATRHGAPAVCINYRELAVAALAHADLTDGLPLRGSVPPARIESVLSTLERNAAASLAGLTKEDAYLRGLADGRLDAVALIRVFLAAAKAVKAPERRRR